MQQDSYSIDLDRESPLEIPAMAKLLARYQGRAKPWHHNQVRRQYRLGVNGIPLPSLLVGKRRISTAGAAKWWIAAITAASAVVGPSGHQATAAALTSAEQSTLEAAGISIAGV
jgi:hypothetical protein